MKLSEAWLREWVDPPVDTATLAERLTMAGLEVGGIDPVAPAFDGVVLGRVLEARQHPNADKLRVCTVDTGDATPVEIVCGAPNVATGQLVPVARVGAKLPGGLKIRKAKLRGVQSQGMICSSAELGIADDADGILVLSGDGQPGTDFRRYWSLDDVSLDIELTPNRGDCLSVEGIAREVGVIHCVAVTPPVIDEVPADHAETFPVELASPDGCPIYAGRIVRGIDPGATTPTWMTEKLRRSGLRPISPVVDVTNYVMLELGQPMHAFDLATLNSRIVVRQAEPGEELTLLDGRTIELAPDVLVIADGGGVRALAGIMGGEDSGVTSDTVDIFFESAFFAPLAVAGRARRFAMHTDASHRFERGVAPGLQARAIERATGLLVRIAGGEPGPVHVARAERTPQRTAVTLERAVLDRLLGESVATPEVTGIFERLGFSVETLADGWCVTPPVNRFDIEIPEDLVEEVARIHGYAAIPEVIETPALPFSPATERQVPVDAALDVLVARGYREIVSYSFVDPAMQCLLDPGIEPIELVNPISSAMSVMRTSLLPGMVGVLTNNLSRQQDRVRIFEHGLTFIKQGTDIIQEKYLAALLYGHAEPESPHADGRAADFYDLKGDLEAVFATTGRAAAFSFVAESHPALHPGQAARIVEAGEPTGWIGALHPAVAATLELAAPAFAFWVRADRVLAASVPAFEALSRFPAVRRDLAFIVAESIDAAKIEAVARAHAPAIVKAVRVFDVYRGKGIDSGLKSVALGLILQDSSRTLTDGDADAAVTAVREALERDLEAKTRD